MKKTTIAIIVLSTLVVASNIWWFYISYCFGVTHTYLFNSYVQTEKALNQTIFLLPVVAQDNITRENIIKATCLSDTTIKPYEKEGYIWVGEIGLKFNNENKLIEARRVWWQ